MSVVDLTHTHPVAAKAHCCWLCRQPIPAGMRYQYRAYVADGDFDTEHLHLWCEREIEWFCRTTGEWEEVSEDWIDDFVRETLLYDYGRQCRDYTEDDGEIDG